MESSYRPPLALTVLSGFFLCLGAICALIVTTDIVLRKGWKSMMWVMIPVYIINATYSPAAIYVYFRHGRPSKPIGDEPAGHTCHAPKENNTEKACSPPEPKPAMEAHCHHHDSSRPMFATVLVGVSHCGAGCVLGDVVGEWLVYGTGASINGQMIWVELLVDYAFALLFGVLFQYFSIAPMSGDYGLKTFWRAAKADIISLTSFEAGAFGWMLAFEVGIFNYRLSMDTWTYWFLMLQVAMNLGFITAMPVNYWLISRGIKEPCA